MGRHSTFSDEIAGQICERVSEGEPLAHVCRDEGYPRLTTVYDWMKAHPAFAESMARAREAGFDHIAQGAADIADEEPPVVEGGRMDPGYIAWQKNRVWTRLQLLAKWAPKKYGDRIEVAGDASAPLTITIKKFGPDA